MIIVNTPTVPGKEIKKTFGIVRGNTTKRNNTIQV